MGLDDVIAEMKEACDDPSIPRRLRDALGKVCVELSQKGKDDAIKITSAVYRLDELSNDVNIPVHAKTVLWDVISHLEGLRGG